ncbi:hypothetical protein L9F63_005659 [Diploptera punctata]|uniref:Uncharacterized protein n=1 Tax=Diploptera punctata TaxID=6984 RepID=A0AAD8E5P8_DIPPU|nr:hypothetical protein L9F63_005659 [Diploptera punctata]
MKNSWWEIYIFTICYWTFGYSYNNQQCHYIKSVQDMLCSHVNVSVLHIGEYPINNTAIKKLTLQNTNISNLDYNIFHNLTNLTVLDLSKNSLQELDYRLFSKSKQLVRLSIAHNNIKLLNKRLFFGLQNLIYLNLAYNKISFLPKNNIFILQMKLMYLSLEGNKLKSISINTLMPLTRLKVLKMLYNIFKCDCKMWDVINWAESKCLKMTATCNSPEKLRGRSWKEIKLIKCKNNNVYSTKNCSMVSCIYNGELGLMDCSDLKLVSLTPYDLWDNGTNILALSLLNNKIQTLKPNVFETISRLQSLNLRLNRITHLESNVFINLTHLKYLDLSKNRLSSLENKLFLSQNKLISLNLQENSISTISTYVLTPLTSLQRLNISQNPLIYDENLKKVFDWSAKQNIFLQAMNNTPMHHKITQENSGNSSFSAINVVVTTVCSFLLVFVPLSVITGIYYYTLTRRQRIKASPVVKASNNSKDSTVDSRKGIRKPINVFAFMKCNIPENSTNEYQPENKNTNCTKTDNTNTCKNKYELKPVLHSQLTHSRGFHSTEDQKQSGMY